MDLSGHLAFAIGDPLKVYGPDAGVDCLGYGEVMMKVQVTPRVK